MDRAFAQVDVFGSAAYRGNPVAVVLDAEGLDDAAMARFASWTNLSETTFVLPATDPGADYRLRIFTPSRELPFAGHPTLGSAHAWLEAGGAPARDGVVVQECGAGLVTLRRSTSGLAFAAPPVTHGGDVEPEVLERLVRGLRVTASDVVASQWVDNGPGWVAVQLPDAAAVLALEPDHAALAGLNVGVVGAHPEGAPEAFEVRAFAHRAGVTEDPVTGSLNASLGQWLTGTGRAPERYLARQGTRFGRHGVVAVQRVDGEVWVGGATTTCVRGTVDL
ncbi:PhzF family phenazine biosynthesis protein [Rhodococcus aerolatus]